MKNSAISMLTVLLLGAASSIAGFDAETENKVQAGLSKGELIEAMFDMNLVENLEDESELNERDLAGNANKKKKLARKAARKAKRAEKRRKRMERRKANKAGASPDPAPEPEHKPEPEPEPIKEMYKELIYMEKECEYYDEQPLNQTFNGTVLDGTAEEIRQPNIGLGDTRSFACELHEAAIKYGTFGGEIVGRTYWFCTAYARVIFSELLETFQEVVWYCTIEDEIVSEGASFRSEGLTLGVDKPDPMRSADPFDVDFDNFQSHTGNFATVGGTGAAKGARGSMLVEYDDYKMTWFHVYTVEVWNIEQMPIIPW